MEKQELQVFQNKEFGELRIVERDGEPWFVGKDVADALGYSETNAMTKRLDREDFISAKLEGMNMKQTIVNESGIYAAIFGSQLPKAKEFKHWVTSEILPSIRKQGAYISDNANPNMLRKKADEIESVTALNEMTRLILPVLSSAGMKPEFQALAVKQIYRKAGIELPVDGLKTLHELFDLKEIARRSGLFSLTGNPHEKAAGAIIRQLDISDDEREIVTFEKNGHEGTTYQYSASVISKVHEWLLSHHYPAAIPSGGKVAYTIQYVTAPVLQ